jgi:hypothetical protein
MASRRQKKSARYSPYSTSDQLSECNKWSTSKFKEVLLKNGVNITSNLTNEVMFTPFFKRTSLNLEVDHLLHSLN